MSRYDTDGDGRCDSPACDGALLISRPDPPFPDTARQLRDDLRAIGIQLTVRVLPADEFFGTLSDPGARFALHMNAWTKDYPSATSFFEPNFGSEAVPPGCCNHTWVGASRMALEEAGYEPAPIPSVDRRIEECAALAFSTQVRCWAELDQYLMEEVVPWVPLVFETGSFLVSVRVRDFSLDQFVALPALDHITLSDG